ncbi:MAG: saccharopine dehydrogenase NADP-binding domain-containing protein [Calditrichaceae bacterium]|nr:saccharopine dehydrogenase NADP-binding domain-containing protein [Calditrichaceae bacterium]MBN2707797.1 saccharopine dehydrogenase NADP-binding domain-containing protein [Calditrichaceae bacterium]RQV96277.1 MAG: hypothetical protein EH224_04935 [Calditrichota bacterium]
MKVLILGAGQMSRGLIHDFLQQKDLEKVTVIDRSMEALNSLKAHFKNNNRLHSRQVAAENQNDLVALFKEANGTVSALPYDFNLNLTGLAIDNHCHFVDLGGNNRVVKEQFKLHDKARNAGIGVVPDCGLAPGMVSVISAGLIDEFARVDHLRIRVGGLPVFPKQPLNYMLVFSVHGLINEYLEPAVFLRDGKIVTAPSLTDVEELEFPRPFGLMEAFITSGGTSTLPETYEGLIDNLDYKTIRYPGHCHIMKAMIDLGFASWELLGNCNISFREAFEAMLSRALSYQDEDVVLIRISAEGRKAGSRKFVRLQAIQYGDKSAGLTAMMRTTAFPAAIILQMLIRNQIKERGVLKQELSVPARLFMEELEMRDIHFDRND